VGGGWVRGGWGGGGGGGGVKVDCDDDASHALNNSVTNTVKIVALK